ncbi:uncharacterized protein LOC130635660 isoform X3 [Hydractinia symbiolongicarpus]|nr:uncharacterized protein LOC130635660 isoform X3 [Hydractinia symbiolongicarpus]XP_057301045.1 uncharacterized protein LOC130635660 isoform X3 [Hydractinia symbiolongicarpus]XP_057301046.1 uncharacterized protein LOC130635660 isoform X3 [Hydractinia symbiolongicarpus]
MDEHRRLRSLLQYEVGKNKSNIVIKELDRNVKHMKQSSDNMEKENLDMEKKLTSLKERLIKDREEQTKMIGPRWRSSQQLKRKPEKQNRLRGGIKVLTDQPVENYKASSRTSKTSDFRLCGQCENRKAKVECNECAELYCSLCYKQFHSKGALRKHTWKSLEQNTKAHLIKSQHSPTSNTCKDSDDVTLILVSGKPAPQTPKPPPLTSSRYTPVKRTSSELSYKQISPDSSLFDQDQAIQKWRKDCYVAASSGCQPNSTPKQSGLNNDERKGKMEKTSPGRISTVAGNAWWEGTYDEEANAASFKDALNEWRRGEKELSVNSATERETSTRSTSVGTEEKVPNGSRKVDIKFTSKSTLSYMDRIIMKRYRKNPDTCFATVNGHFSLGMASSPGMKSSRTPSPKETTIEPIGLTPKNNSLKHRISSVTPSSNNIAINPLQEECFGGVESDAIPIITPAPSDCDIKKNDQLKPTTICVNIVELNCCEQADNVSKPLLPMITHERVTNEVQQKENSYPEEKKEREYVDISWRPPPRHQNMDDYFMLGITRTSLNKNSGGIVEMQRKEENVLVDGNKLITAGSVWSRESSYPSVPGSSSREDETKLDEEISSCREERMYSYGQLPTLTVGSYDFVHAPPPPVKGDNYHKVHRASTSFSLSAQPVDPWVDSDASLPGSRRPSHLSTFTPSRKTSREFDEKPIVEFEEELKAGLEDIISSRQEQDGREDFQAIDMLADQVSIMYGDNDDDSIEDNDEGSGLTTPDSLCNENH